MSFLTSLSLNLRAGGRRLIVSCITICFLLLPPRLAFSAKP